MLNQVCFRTLEFDQPWTLDNYKKVGGYAQLEAILREKRSPQSIIDELKLASLRGRGGAGFPTGLKLSFLNRDAPGQKYLLANCDESEPGTCKDREIMLNNPHQLIEGMLIAAYTIGASVGYHFLRGEFHQPFERLEQAVAEAAAAGYLGENILGSGFNFDLHNHLAAGAYICGEETALMNALEGKRAWPRLKPPFPANFGLYGQPTNINNTESLASIPPIMQHGGQWFADLGVANSGGAKIMSVSGHVNQPGNYEIPMGMPFRELLDLAGGVRHGHQLKAVIPGGSSMPVVPAADIIDATVDYDGMVKAGSYLGSGGMIIMDDSTCMVDALRVLMKFYQHESCGQCTPCREGTTWTYRLANKIASGNGLPADLERLAHVVDALEGRTICVFGEAVAWPVKSFLKHFYHEFEYYVTHGHSMVAGTSSAVV